MLALLIRHAHVEAQDRIGVRAQLPLSEHGEAQARALADRMRSYEIAAIYTSPLRRTVQTAEYIGEPHALPVTPAPALTELNPGDWDDRRFADLREDRTWKHFNTFRSGTRIPGGEMMIEVQARVAAFLEKISHEHRDRTVAVVSHADVIRAAVCHYAGIPLDLCLRVEISPASLTMIEIADWGARLIRLNDTRED